MRAVVQRVSKASVSVEGQEVGVCGVGFVVWVAAHRNDTPAQAEKLAQRIAGLRIFNDEQGKMNLSLAEVPGSSVLAISNFTIYGETAKTAARASSRPRLSRQERCSSIASSKR